MWLHFCYLINISITIKMADHEMLAVLQPMQMHHARLLFIVTELYRKDLISEDQKLALKFGIFNDDGEFF